MGRTDKEALCCLRIQHHKRRGADTALSCQKRKQTARTRKAVRGTPADDRQHSL